MRAPFVLALGLIALGCGGQVQEQREADESRAALERQMAEARADQAKATAAAQRTAEDQRRAAAKEESDARTRIYADCARDRGDRVTQAKATAAARLAAEALLLKHAKAVRSRCKISEKRASEDVRVWYDRFHGFRVAHETTDDLRCTSGLPDELKKDDAYVILYRFRETGTVAPSGPILTPENHSSRDEACAAYDRAAGVDLNALRFADPSSVERLNRWSFDDSGSDAARHRTPP